jgi:prefoldin subunit 5
MTSNDSKIEKIQLHFQALTSLASALNVASDELSKNVSILDEALKKLNIGLTTWVTFRSQAVEENEYSDDQIGYCKVEGKWGIALRHIWGDYGRDEYGGETGPWLFNDAPREFRIAAADKIPEVIEALGKEALNTTKKVQEKARQVGELASVIEKIANAPKVKSTNANADPVIQALKTLKTVTLSDGGTTKEGGK